MIGLCDQLLVTNYYKFLHFNLFYINLTRGSRKAVLLFSHMRNLDVNIDFRKKKTLKVHRVAALPESSGDSVWKLEESHH